MITEKIYTESELKAFFKRKLLEYITPRHDIYYHQYDCYKENHKMVIFGNLFNRQCRKKIMEDDGRFSINTNAIFPRHWKYLKDIEIAIDCTYKDDDLDVFLDFSLKEVGITKKQKKSIERMLKIDNSKYAKEYYYLTLRKKGDFFGLY